MNRRLFFKLNSLVGRSVFFDRLVVFFAKDFVFLFWTWLILCFLFPQIGGMFNLTRKNIFFVHLIGALVWFLTLFIKMLCFTPRPMLLKKTKVLIRKRKSSSAFPSGHTALFFALGGICLYSSLPLAISAFIFGFLVGLSRIIAGLHWPIDILGGAGLGWLVSFLVCHFGLLM